MSPLYNDSLMRLFSLLFVGLLLVGCKASVSMGLDGELEHGLRFFGEEKQVSSVAPVPTGDFTGKFATSSAINSDRTFVADYYGTLHMTVLDNGKIECDWVVDGRMRDVAYGGVLRASSSVCLGRVQSDGTFSFRGAFIAKGIADDAESAVKEHPSFTMEGSVKRDGIEGNLILGDAFAANQGKTDIGVAFLLIPVTP